MASHVDGYLGTRITNYFLTNIFEKKIKLGLSPPEGTPPAICSFFEVHYPHILPVAGPCQWAITLPSCYSPQTILCGLGSGRAHTDLLGVRIAGQALSLACACDMR